jgi:4-alpha-glucanotransferase
LRKAYGRFAARASSLEKLEFEGFCRGKAGWLEDYALFMALRDFHGDAVWTAWPRELRARDPQALQKYRRDLNEDVTYYKFLQFEFFRQWSRLKQYAHDQNLQIIGDLPIYVAHNSVDVWAYQEVFQLDSQTSEPLEVAGVPPDYFSKTGQLWGNPLYDWKYLESTGFEWWIRRIRDTLTQVDLIRIDHFRGLESYWSVPAGEETAMNGRWVRAPGYPLFNKLREELGYLPIIAEDLGIIGPEVIALRDHFGFPGMNILHFAFDTDASNPYLPHNLSRNSLIYAGTHDNNTTRGWFSEDASDVDKAFLNRYLGPVDREDIAWDFIRLAMSSMANRALITLQDVLGLGSEARMNRPGEADGNWAWRYRDGALTQEHSERLKEMAVVFGRHEAG